VSSLRPFEPADIPAVVKLRSRSFRQTTRADPADMAAYLKELFFDSPWGARAAPSWVLPGDKGELAGFVGMLTRPMKHRGREIRLGTPTQLMADPEAGPLAGVSLLRAVFSGPHDCLFSDTANDVARRLWEGLGGATQHALSLMWERPVSLAHAAAAVPGTSLPARAARVSLRTLGRGLDLIRGDREIEPPADLATRPLTPADGALLPELIGRVSLVPVYEPAVFGRQLEAINSRSRGAMIADAMIETGGKVAGWYIVERRNERWQLVQLVASAEKRTAILQGALRAAAKAGAISLHGRYDPLLAPSLGALEARISRTPPWTLVHSREPALLRSMLDGDAFLSRIEGEWWLDF